MYFPNTNIKYNLKLIDDERDIIYSSDNVNSNCNKVNKRKWETPLRKFWPFRIFSRVPGLAQAR